MNDKGDPLSGYKSASTFVCFPAGGADSEWKIYVLGVKFQELTLGRGINLSSGQGQTICQVTSAFFRQTTGSGSDGRARVAPRAACAPRRRKCWKSKRHNESALELSLPAVWQVVKTKDWQAAISDGWRRRTIMLEYLEVSEHGTLTIAILSERNSKRFKNQRWPHK